MSGLAFTSSLTQSLVWPAAVIVLALIFRVKLSDLIDRIRSIKVGPAEVTADAKLASVKANLQAMWAATPLAEQAVTVSGAWLGDTAHGRQERSRLNRWLHQVEQDRYEGSRAHAQAPQAGDTTSITSRYMPRVTAISKAANYTTPAATVLSAWSCLESLLRELAQLVGVSDTGDLGLLVSEIITALDRRGGMPAPDHARSVIQTLHELKQSVDGGTELTKLEASDYADAVLQITEILIAAYEPPRLNITDSLHDEPATHPNE